MSKTNGLATANSTSSYGQSGSIVESTPSELLRSPDDDGHDGKVVSDSSEVVEHGTVESTTASSSSPQGKKDVSGSTSWDQM